MIRSDNWHVLDFRRSRQQVHVELMPIFKRTLSEFLFRRFVLKHYGSNLLVDLQLDAKKDTIEYVKSSHGGRPVF